MYLRRLLLSTFVAAIIWAAGAAAADINNYRVTILVSNEPGEAPVIDSKLQNGWGIATAGSSPWWVSDNGSDWSTVYNGAGVKQSREVVVPGGPTGIVGNTGSQFVVGPRPALFIWATESGAILGWNSGLADPTHAQTMFAHAGSIFKGLAIHGNTLYATDFGECKVEMFNGTFQPLNNQGAFEDETIPANYCPFGIQAIGDSIFVTYALKGGEDDVAGQGHGFVREFDVNGNLVAAVAEHGQLNSPWGLTMAPSTFGRFGGCLLVGNFGDGTINAYCLDDEGQFHFQGTLREDRKPLVIDGLWGIGFGNNAGAGSPNVLYFAAGPDEEANGYFGKVEFAP